MARRLSKAVDVSVRILNDGNSAFRIEDIRSHLNGIEWQFGNGLSVDDSSVEILDLEQPSCRRYLKHKEGQNKACLTLDYFDPMVLPAITVNLLDHSGKMRAAYSSVGRQEDYMEGPDYAIIRQDILNLRNAAPVGESVRKIVVTMGGADPAMKSIEALQLLCNIPNAGYAIVVIIGPFFSKSYEEILRSVALGEMTFPRNPTEFDRYLAEADVVMCSGGGTLLEALSLGKPTIVFPQNEAEKFHALFHFQAGACVFSDSLYRVLTDSFLRKYLSEKACRQVDGLGVERIAKAAIELLNRGSFS